MRRLLLTACAVALLVAAFAGVASARLDSSGADAADSVPRAPFDAPASMPAPDPDQATAWGFRSSAALARQLEGGTGTSSSGNQPATGGASASVTVTATVLPVVILVIDADGDLQELVTNTVERDARGVLYLVRTGSPEGAPAPLDRALWGQARAALARTGAGLGTVWAA